MFREIWLQLMKNALFYRNVDHVVEHCTVNWESYYPCHFMHLWWSLKEHVIMKKMSGFEFVCSGPKLIKLLGAYLGAHLGAYLRRLLKALI